MNPTRSRRRLRAVVATAVAAILVTGVGTAAWADVTAPVHATAASAPLRTVPGQGRTAATEQQQAGVVDVDTVLDYGSGRAAGTGIVLSPDGEILTNNHVIEDSTSISVTVVATGATYPASVVGTDASDDVAVLQLRGASGLTPAVLATPAQERAAATRGTAVTAVGNAGGTGGIPSAASGTVVGTGRTITASDETGANSERLSGLIEVTAAIEAGDSGGPLYAGDTVIGIDTAGTVPATPSYRTTAADDRGTASTGFAIPIGTALDIAGQITSGVRNGTVEQGYPAFLGVQVASGANGSGTSDGVRIAGVVPGSPAAGTGLTAGDVIVSVGGRTVSDPDGLTSALAGHAVGDRVDVTWTDASGTTQTATVTLTAGPAR